MTGIKIRTCCHEVHTAGSYYTIPNLFKHAYIFTISFFKTLITLALDAVVRADAGVNVLAKRARDLGASEEEIRETLRLAYYVAGNGVLATGMAAYK